MSRTAAMPMGMLYHVSQSEYEGEGSAYATPSPIGRAREMSVGLAHVSALGLLLQLVVAADPEEEVVCGILRTNVTDGFSGARMFLCTKPIISERSGTLGRLRCPPRGPRFGISKLLFVELSPHGCQVVVV